jgi:predicted pyridoxine 5'-phosphate oxidase superfamily flavin-nucleotide-binding protein
VGKIYTGIDDALAEWMGEQHVYFVATAPLDADGHVNVSPKGGRGSFQVLDPQRVAYLDIAGSGAETIAHLRENGRIVVMFCAFDGRPRIVRVHGRGRVHQTGDTSFDALLSSFDGAGFDPASLRSVIEVDVTRVADSCGYSVPLMSFDGIRPNQELWTQKRLAKHGPDGVVDYMRQKNEVSLDGLPALDPDRLDRTSADRP